MRLRSRSSTTGLSVGIDLGTTYSAVARVNDLGKPEILSNREGESITPSVVLFDGDQPVVGTMAKRSVAAAPLDAVQFVKRSMGDASWRFETREGTAWRPEEVSALLLKRLKQDAERALDAEVTEAVITVPAYFDDAPRRATIDAGTIAGLNVRRVLNEPTAAALAYGLDREADGTVLVYDLGGGTFDVTVMRIEGSDYRVLATHGDRNLGGFDFDNALMRLLNERFIAAGGPDLLDDDLTEADLRDRAEIAKHSLTSTERTVVGLSAGGFSTTVPLTRSDLDDACSGLLGRTRDIAEIVLDDAGVAWNRLDRVLLAGGSTRMPMVREMFAKLSPMQPDLATNPDEIVAHGAAIQAKLLDQEQPAEPARFRLRNRPPQQVEDAPLPAIRVHDVTSQGLGVLSYERVGDDSRLNANSIIIPPNTPVPASGAQTYRTLWDDQQRLEWNVTQGNDTDPDYVRVVSIQSTYLPHYPAGAEVEVSFRYDADQVIHAEVTDLTSGKSAGGFQVSNIHNMSTEQVSTSAMRIRSTNVS